MTSTCVILSETKDLLTQSGCFQILHYVQNDITLEIKETIKIIQL